MPPIDVVVPYRWTVGRDRVWRWVRARYRRFHPDWHIVTGSCGGIWSKGCAVADGLRHTTGDVVVVADADSFVSVEILEYAVELAGTVPWVMPHRRVLRVSPEATCSILERLPVDVPDRCRSRRHRAPVGGGIIVARRDILERIPCDPRFVLWGGEDISWGRALDTLAGPHVALTGDLWHLYHAEQTTRQNALPEVNRLAGRYLDATGDAPAMRALLDEW